MSRFRDLLLAQSQLLKGIHYVADWDAKGRSNDEGADVRNKWVDKVTGKVIDLYDFDYAGMSGWGGYGSTIWQAHGNTTEQINSNTVKMGSSRFTGVKLDALRKGESLTICYRITGLPSGSTLSLYTNTTNSEGGTTVKIIRKIKKDGIYTDTATWDSENAADDTKFSPVFLAGRDATYPEDMAVLAEQLPLYPGALVSDGINSYGLTQETIKEKVGTMLVYARLIDKPTNSYHILYTSSSSGNNGGLYLLKSQDSGYTWGLPNKSGDNPPFILTREPVAPDSKMRIASRSTGFYSACFIQRIILIQEQLNDIQVEFLKQKVEREYREWCEKNGYDYAINQL